MEQYFFLRIRTLELLRMVFANIFRLILQTPSHIISQITSFEIVFLYCLSQAFA